MLWGGWLVVTLLVFSFMQGIFHAYYTVALAPAVAALAGIGAAWLWERHDLIGRWILSSVTLVTALWSYILLARSASFLPWLRPLVLVAGLAAALMLATGAVLGRRVLAVAAAGAVFAGLAGPAAYAVQTAGTSHSGSIVTAGPTVAGVRGGPAFGLGFGRGGGFGPGGQGGPAGGFAPAGPGGTTQGGAGDLGGLPNGTTPSTELTQALLADADDYTWVAAAIGSNNASGYQLATQKPVMAIGGFNGSDPSPTLAQFQAHVAAGKIHYFIGGGIGGNSRGGSRPSSEISAWAQENFTPTTIGGVTVYDLTAGTSTAAS
jgi:4-amino-4-deoxy-L-arabinose transferase-like glycosyltransferase